MDRLTSMEVFVRVAEAGSFAAAAKACSLSTTMVANHVRALESRMGARLIDRTTRRHRLTDIGAAYLERCREALQSVQSADRVAEELRAVPRGTLRMTAPVSYGVHRLMPVVADYMRRHPEVRIELSLNDRVVDLMEEGFELGVRSGDVDHPGLVVRPLRPSRMYAVASRSYLRRQGKPRHPHDLLQHNCLGFMAWGRDHTWRFTRAGETVHVPVRGSFECNSGQALLNAALCGIGVVVQADVLLDEAIADGRLVRLLPDWELPQRAIHVVRTQDARPSAKLRSFIDFVVGRLG